MLQQIIVRITLGRVKEGTIEPKQGKGRRERKSERRGRKRGKVPTPPMDAGRTGWERSVSLSAGWRRLRYRLPSPSSWRASERASEGQATWVGRRFAAFPHTSHKRALPCPLSPPPPIPSRAVAAAGAGERRGLPCLFPFSLNAKSELRT